MTLARLTSIVALAGCTCARVARAEDRDPGKAEKLFQEAKELLVLGDWDAACPKLESSLEKDRSAGTQFNVARCKEHAALYADAWSAYHEALRLNEQTESGERHSKLERLAAKAIALLEPRLSRIKMVIVDPPPNLEVRCDGDKVPGADWADSLLANPGRHELVTSAPGYRSARIELILNEGELRVVNITLVREPAPRVEVATTARMPVLDAERRPLPSVQAPTSLRVAWGLGIAGGLSLGAAGYFGIRTLKSVHDSAPYCNPANECTQAGYDLRKEARVDQTVGITLLGVGLASVVAGILLGSSTRSSEARVAVMARPHAVDLALGLPW